MQTDEFISLTEDAVVAILRQRYGYADEGYRDQRRDRPRWPFPGTVELWVPHQNGAEQYLLARALNLSTTGVGILVDSEMSPGQEVSIAIHQPEATLLGKAVVRHCAPAANGNHVGLEFLY